MTNPMEMINGEMVEMSDADYSTFQTMQATVAAAQPNNLIKQQIVALEATQTPRRMREALADPTWLNALNIQIATLRAQLT